MAESSIAEATAEALTVDADEFQSRVIDDAEVVKDYLDQGVFDNPQGIIGLEYEFYAVADPAPDSPGEDDEDRGALMRVPRQLLSLIGFEKELGLHNAEMNTSPQPMNPHGLAAQESEVCARLSAALDRTRVEGLRLVSDAMWTIPPPGESARNYLTDYVVDDGIRIATNMSDATRYHAMANSETPAGMRIEAPHVSFQSETIMPESLITSIQPHYQVPHARDLPEYFRYAIRIAGPLLALGVNSPFFPPELYDADVDPHQILEDAWLENRISVFETVMNTDRVQKVRFPSEITTVEEAVDQIATDRTFVPMPVERGDRFDDEFAYFRMKHGTYWRWIRPVFEGATKAEANARIEFRPIPAQPTVRDSMAFQAAFAGLIEGMHARNHPVADLDWEDARSNFYGAMRSGLYADLQWITQSGDPTGKIGPLYADLFETAAAGLRARGFDDEQVGRVLGPLRARVREGRTPGRWKLRAVSRRLDEGLPFEEAVYGMQRTYLDKQTRSLIGGGFADWSAG